MRGGHPSQGFTLIEVLVVIAIIAVLATILLPNLLGAQKRPNDAAALLCGRAIIRAQTVYKIQNETYTPALAALGEDVQDACQNVQVQSYAAGFTPSASTSGNGVIGADAGQYNFWVWSQRGSKSYYTSTGDGWKLKPYNAW